MTNKQWQAEYMKSYYAKNKERMNKDTASRRKLDKDKYLEYQYKYRKERLEKDPQFKLINSMRKRVSKALKSKSKTTLELLGCTASELRIHIERQLRPNMTWANYGVYGWHVDHIIPLASAADQAQLEKLCHYTNLQPLWAKENLQKSDKLAILSLT